MQHSKVIQDPVHGSIPVGGVFLDILDRHEMQRLRYVKQLGLGNLVFPGANHTRFEHCLGTYHLAGRMASAVGLNREDSDTVMMAGLLHDICHPAFSHTLEHVMEQAVGLDHMELARALIHGDVRSNLPDDDPLFDGECTIAEVLECDGIPSQDVCDLIAYPDSISDTLDSFTGVNDHFPSRDYAHQIIHGPVDADQMDYLMRDAHYTGISHGTIDCDRLINTMGVHNDRIVIRRGGITAAEGLMVSRSLMYTSVYFHETKKIAEKMLVKAVQDSNIPKEHLHLMTDGDLVSALTAEGGRSALTVRRIVNRDIDKKAFALYSSDMDEETVSKLIPYTGDGVSRLEQEIADQAGLDVYDVSVQLTSKNNLQSVINIGKTDVSIIDDEGKVRSLARFSPIARSLQARDPYGWAVLISASKQNRDIVEKASKKVLGISL